MGITERKEREKERRRQEIIDAAERVFFREGIDRASMDQVAEEAELSKGTLYLYFKSREDLHWAIAERGMQVLREFIGRNLAEEPSGAAGLVAIGRCFIEFSESHPDYFDSLLFFEGRNLEKLNLTTEHIREAFFGDSPIMILQGVIEKGMADGSIRSGLSAAALTHTLWAQTLGVLQVIRNKKEVFDLFGIDRQSLIQSHFEILKNGILQ